MTSGRQVAHSANTYRESGVEIIRVLCVIEREEDGRKKLAAQGLELSAFYTIQPLKSGCFHRKPTAEEAE